MDFVHSQYVGILPLVGATSATCRLRRISEENAIALRKASIHRSGWSGGAGKIPRPGVEKTPLERDATRKWSIVYLGVIPFLIP